MKFLSNLAAIFRIPDLRKRVLYTLGLILVFRAGAHIPIPGIDTAQLKNMFDQNGLLGFVDLFSGGALSNFSVFAMGIVPYINASIIMQLLMIILPQLKEIAEEGEHGRKQISQYTRYLTVVLAFVQGAAITLSFRNLLSPNYSFGLFFFSSMISLVAGTIMVMWLGELITERGIGNGASLLIFAGIVARLPDYIGRTITLVQGGTSLFWVAVMLGIFMFVILGIVIVQEAQRKIPVQYAKRIIGRKVYGGQSTFIPLRINQGGVIPIIFASSVLLFPSTIARVIPGMGKLSEILYPGRGLYMFLFFALIFFFTYFYTAVTFNPTELANNIQKYGGFILGVRPGKPTAEFLEKIITRLTLVGALFLGAIAILPMIAANVTHVTSFTGLGGTALLIIVGVALDLLKQIETHLINREYEGVIHS
jgi:preprotein translocase subunit SecY